MDGLQRHPVADRWPGPSGSGPYPVIWRAQSADARRVFFYTEERLVPEDIDGFRDIYVARAGALELVSFGPRAGNGSFEPWLGGISADGSSAFFHTPERLVRRDRDRGPDLYMRRSGKTVKIGEGARFQASSPSGDLVLFTTNDRSHGETVTKVKTSTAGLDGALGCSRGRRPEGDRDPGSLYIEFAERSECPPRLLRDHGIACSQRSRRGPRPLRIRSRANPPAHPPLALSDLLAQAVEHLLDPHELHPRAAVGLAGAHLRLVDQLPVLEGDEAQVLASSRSSTAFGSG